MKKHIPNFITSLNLVSGFIAIALAAGGDVLTASWFIMAAMIFDFFDGFSARMLKAYSDIGKELDSLADIVSFGVAPGLIIYHFLSDSLVSDTQHIAGQLHIRDILILLIPAIMPVCAALRLAIFNLDTTQTNSFKGLPTPANAIAVISLVIGGHYSQSTAISFITGTPLLLILFTIALSVLMVSRINLFSLKIPNLSFKGNEGRYLLALLLLISFMLMGIKAAPLVIPLYILASLVSLLF